MSEQVRDFYAKEIDFDNGPVKCVLKSDYDALHAEAEALRAENWRLAESLRVAHHNLGVGFDTETALTGQLEAARGLLRELIGAVRTINHGPQHKIMVKGDDQPSYWQRQEWVVYLLRMCNEAEAALTATPAPEVQAEQGERQEAVAWKVVGVHEKHRHPHVLVEHTLKLAEGQAAHWRNRGCSVEVIPLYTTPQPGPDVRGLVEAIAICEQEAAEWDSDAVVADKNYAAACAQRIHALAAHRQAQRQA